jgi:hypothetical protein
MTPDELRARCEAFAKCEDHYEFYDYVGDTVRVSDLEALCREMIAEGLRRAVNN